MSASAAGVSSACFQQEEWSGVGFGPVVFRVHNANLSPYLRSFPRQRIFQGSGKSNWKCIRLPICFFPGRQKAKRFRLPICFFPAREKAKWFRLPICFFPSWEKAKWFRLPFCFFPAREKAKWFRLHNLLFSKPGKKQNGSDFQFAFSRAGKEQNGSEFQFAFSPGREKANMAQTCSLEPGLETSRACGIRALSRALSIRRQLSEKFAFFQALQGKIGCPKCFSSSNFQFAFLPGVTTMLYAHLQP